MECDCNLFQSATLLKSNPLNFLSYEFLKNFQTKPFIEHLLANAPLNILCYFTHIFEAITIFIEGS